MTIFDTVIPRHNTNSLKYDDMTASFGTNDLLPLWVADMDFKAPQPVLDAIAKRLEHGILGYTSRPESYFEAITNWYAKEHCFEIDRAHILHAPTVVASLSTLIRVLTEPDDGILIQTPVYYPFKNIIVANQRQVIENPLVLQAGRYHIDFEDFEAKIKNRGVKLFILCNPHNPVGRVWTKEELSRLSAICRAHGVQVISDEIHCDFALFGHVYCPFANVSDYAKANTITCLSTSKTFNLAGLQASFLVIPQTEIREKTSHALYFQDIARNNCFSLVATEAALREGKPWLSALKSYLEVNITFLIAYSEAHLPGFKVLRPEGTYLVWIDVSSWGLNSQASVDQFFIEEAKVAVDAGYWFGESGNGFVRLNVACPKVILSEALDRIKSAAQNRGWL